MTAGRNGMGKFWSCMASLDRKVPVCELRDENTKEKVEDIARHLTAHIRGIYDSTQPHDSPTFPTAFGTANPEDSLWKGTRLAIDRVISKISSKTPKGLNGIAAGLVKCLGERAREHLATIYTGIIQGDPLPADWLQSRVCLVSKRGGDASFLSYHRLITVTSVIRMQNMDMPPTWIDLLQRLYSNNTVIATFGQTSTEPVSVCRGLKQGCTLSPLLHMLYTSVLERDLIGSGLGFALRFQYAGSPQIWTLPGRAFASSPTAAAWRTRLLTLGSGDVAGPTPRCA
ncbi:hypothetical protein MRX96_041544 [Rhipicephalus microplus]